MTDTTTTVKKELTTTEIRKLEDEFIKKFGDGWKMPSYYNWNDANVSFYKSLLNGKFRASFTYNTKDKKASCLKIESVNIDEKDLQRFAQNTEEFLLNMVCVVPQFVKDNQIVIDFAQDTIIKALRGK